MLAALIACGQSSNPASMPPLRAAPTEAGVSTPGPAIAPPLPAPSTTFDAAPPKEPIAELVASQQHTCVLRRSGAVDCWGAAYAPPFERPRRIPGVTDARAIGLDMGGLGHRLCVLRPTGVACADLLAPTVELEAVDKTADIVTLANGDPSCGVTKDGRVLCWDEDSPPRDVGVRGARTASVMEQYGCAVTERGGIACGGISGRWRPVAKLAGVESLRLGHQHHYQIDPMAGTGGTLQDACAVLRGGTLRCFQLDGAKWQNDAATAQKEGELGLFVIPPEARTHSVSAIAMSSRSTLAMLVSGKVMFVRQERDDPSVKIVVETVPKLVDAVAITDRCALRATGAVVCWGTNHDGVAGQYTTLGRAVAVDVVGLANVRSIYATSDDETHAIDASDALLRWGRGSTVPVASQPGVTAVGRSRHDARPCVLRSDRTVVCLDNDDVPSSIVAKDVVALRGYAALRADGTVALVGRAAEVSELANLRDAVEVDASFTSACFRDRAGAVHCGDVSCNAKSCTVAAFAPIGVGDAVELAVGGVASCARRHGGDVTCWGLNEHGIVAIPKQRATLPPTRVPGIDDATSIAIGYQSACAIRRTGALVCWGMQTQRDGEATTSEHGPQVIEPNGVIAAALDRGRTCIVRQDRRVTCWGTHTNGELGDGSIDWLDTPAAVPGL